MELQTVSEYIEYAIIIGITLDLLIGDPAFIMHPVVLMGKAISFLERVLRKAFPSTDQGELSGGAVLACIMVLGTFGITCGISFLAFRLSPVAFLVLQAFWCWQAVAIKDMRKEGMGVYKCLTPVVLIEKARKQVARIVGRDTEELSAEAVARAAIESVAESFSDGIISPLFYMLIGGAPLALTYKAVNTMDSMIGYKNDRYMYFGRVAARIDDVFNFIPSRLAALTWIAASFFGGYDSGSAFKIWLRDRKKSPSPNAGQTEAACAGSLGIRLLGPAVYFGKLHEKEYVGDATREVTPGDIKSACDLMLIGSILFAAIGLVVRGFVIGMF